MAMALRNFVVASALLFSPSLGIEPYQSYLVAGTGTFQNPAAIVRPRFRYWLPDASVEEEQVKADIKAAASVGAGGVEFLSYYNYGGQRGSPPAGIDWAETGFGTAPFRRIFRAALEAHKETGTLMDFPLGPNQAQGVPARRDDEGLQWDLVPFTEKVSSSGSFDKVVPGWGTGELIALVTAHIVDQEDFVRFSPGWGGGTNTTWVQYVIKHGSLEDHTSKVSNSTGRVNLDLPKAVEGEHYRLFAYYQNQPLHKNLKFKSSKHENIWDDGSYVVDHFSARGAETTINFWEENILVDGIDELLKEAGFKAWEDSVEIHSNISWTPSLPERFQARFKYSVQKYLPLLSFAQNNLGTQANTPGAFDCIIDTPDHGAGHVNDFRAILQDAYGEYLTTLKNWTNTRLGHPFSAQPSYNLPMDMSVSIPRVDITECESLGQLDSIDAYRQFAGPAHLSGQRIISNELGAAVLKAYSYTLPELLFSINRALVGGINHFIIHGQTFGGDYPQTTWPGYTPFSYLFSELYSPKQPAWEHGFSDVIDYMARMQRTQQQGTPRTDVAVYKTQWSTDPKYPLIYEPRDLEASGWSYTYVSPLNFDLPQAYVKDGFLAPEGPAWKALVIERTQNLTVQAIRHLKEYSEAGLPVIISGGKPGYYPSRNGCSATLFAKELASLLKAKNVHECGRGEVANKLTALGLRPRISAIADGTNATWYATWREDVESGTAYAFVLNDSPDQRTGEVVVSSTGTPYTLDAWSGEQQPLLKYRVEGDNLKIPLTLAGNQATVFAFNTKPTKDVGQPKCHLKSAPANILGSKHKTSDELTLHLTGVGEVILSTGKTVAVGSAKVAQSFSMKNWTVVAERWEKPSDLYNASAIAVKRNTTHALPSLVAWTEVPALVNVSGVGYYTSSFDWPPSGDASGAYIQLPAVLHALRVYVNGELIPVVEYRGGRQDISSYLKNGENEVLAVVPTTMWNYIRTFWDDVMNSGARPDLATTLRGSLLPATKNGLVGNVTVVPFTESRIKC